MANAKLVTMMRRAMRARHMSLRTERAYVAWVRRYVRFCGMRHPRECGVADVCAFLESLAVRSAVAAATQNQACAAVQFLYLHVVGRALGGLPAYVRARRPHRLPNVLDSGEVAEVLSQLVGVQRLVVMLLYGAGLRLNEALALRAKDVDVRRRTITVRDGKGGKDRRTVLPEVLVPQIEEQLRRVRMANLRDARIGGIRIPLPYAMDRKAPSATTDWRWAWLFPASRTYMDRRRGERLRDHLHDSTIQRAIAAAAKRARVNKRVSAHTFRHSFATQLLRGGSDIRTVQQLLGHRDVSTTMVYLHVLDRGPGVRSPLDSLSEAAAVRSGSVPR